MKWFSGSIEDAVNEARHKNSFFVVYVEGFDRSSEIMTSILNSNDISAILESENYVSVRVKFDSEEYHHFVEIYKHVPVPSFFVIGLNGVPIAVVNNLYGEDINALYQEIKTALATKGKGLAGNVVQTGAQDFIQPDSVSKNMSLNAIKLGSDKRVNEIDEISVHENFDFLKSSSVVVIDSSNENKPENDVEKLNKKENKVSSNNSSYFKQATDEADKENKKDNTIASRSYSKGKRQMDDEDFRIQEIQQERIRNERDRQRILYDIAIDKQERLLRQQVEKNSNGSNNLTEPNPTTSVTVSIGNQTQIQFRKPDGSTHTKIFDKSSIVNELHSYVVEHIHINSRRFKLGTAFPRHIFTEDESNKSLEELNLVPNAVIIIIPVSEENSAVTYMYSQVYLAFTFVTKPVVTLFCFIRDSIFRTTQPQIQQGILRPPQETNENPSASSRIAARNRKLSNQTSSMSQRNVHTMAHVNNDRNEDKNNVWNGNSTQQTQ